ncbi:hypothetical protein Amsp01_093540 [Amycolatopsis sp. NBRC 101858]|uniref:TetR/AcrR family transcriptional regulator n=1 Tax=Amycolatopsis sp. NBRC 101858 TaxID=3032200 RepID=UPI0024A0381C|nr:TetR/AcrR family transcriptional regulator [Amycolatopsis sp. NBRC 101858]GLY43331.1 hypothetical protein Amsp01_093540 [Amycolatopsis sp. NBRC 101858]
MTRPYKSVRRTSAAAETRRAVLAAALALFEERGYVGATLAEIATRAEVAVNTVYTSVGGKPQLLIELIREAANNDQIDDSLRKVNSARSGREVVAEVAQGTAAVFRDRAWLLGALYDNAGTEPLLTEAVENAEAAYADRLAEAAARVAALGELRDGIDVATASDILWFHFGFRPWRDLRARGWSWERAGAWLASQACHALLAQRPATR